MRVHFVKTVVIEPKYIDYFYNVLFGYNEDSFVGVRVAKLGEGAARETAEAVVRAVGFHNINEYIDNLPGSHSEPYTVDGDHVAEYAVFGNNGSSRGINIRVTEHGIKKGETRISRAWCRCVDMMLDEGMWRGMILISPTVDEMRKVKYFGKASYAHLWFCSDWKG